MRGKELHHLLQINKNDDLLFSILAITASSTTASSTRSTSDFDDVSFVASELNTLDLGHFTTAVNLSTASASSASNYIPHAATVERFHEAFFNINKKDVIRILEQCGGDEDAAAELMLQMSEKIQEQQGVELSLKMDNLAASSGRFTKCDGDVDAAAELMFNEKENYDISLNSCFDDVSSIGSLESLYRAHDYTLDDVCKCAEAESTNTTPTNKDDMSSNMLEAFSDFGDFSMDCSLLSPNELQQCFTSAPVPPSVDGASTPPSSIDVPSSKRPAASVEYDGSLLTDPRKRTKIIATSSSMITDSDDDGISSNDDSESVTAVLRMYESNCLLRPEISEESCGTQDLMKAICNCICSVCDVGRCSGVRFDEQPCTQIGILTDEGYYFCRMCRQSYVGMERKDTPPSVKCNSADITNSEQYQALIEEVWKSIFEGKKRSTCPIIELHKLIQEVSNEGEEKQQEEFGVDGSENVSLKDLFEEKPRQHCSFSKYVYGDPSRKLLLLPVITRLLCKHFGYDKTPLLQQMIVSLAMNEKLPKKLCHFYFSENYLAPILRKIGVTARSFQEYITNISILVRASLFLVDLINIADIYQMLDIVINNIFVRDVALSAQSVAKVFAALHFTTSHLVLITSEAFKQTASNPTTNRNYNVSDRVLRRAVMGPIVLELIKCVALFGFMPNMREPIQHLMERLPQLNDLLKCYLDTSSLRQYLDRLCEELGDDGNSDEMWDAVQITDVEGGAKVLTLPLFQIAFTCYLKKTLLNLGINGFEYCLKRRLWPARVQKRVEVEHEEHPTFRHFEFSHGIVNECSMGRILAEVCLPHHEIEQMGISGLLMNDEAKPFDFNFKCVEHDRCIRAIKNLLRKADNNSGLNASQELCEYVSELTKVLQISVGGDASSSDWAAVAAQLSLQKE